MKIKVKKIHSGAKLPNYAHEGDAGMDIYSNESVKIRNGSISKVKTGVSIEIPDGYVGLVWDKSGIALSGVHTLAGVVDSGYRGEVAIVLTNLSGDLYSVEKGQKIAQILVQKIESVNIEEVDKLDDTARGSGGFGSTGVT